MPRPEPDLGVIVDGARLLRTPALARDDCTTLEQCGVESVWVVEHLAIADDYTPAFPYANDGRMRSDPQEPRPDPLDLLAWLAAQSTTLRLGTSVLIAPLHPPVMLAKRAATIDVLSGGRLLLGLGIGWQREEYAALGVPFAERGARLEDTITALRVLWGEQPATYRGRFVELDRLWCRPRPIHGTVPILAGGNSAGAVARAGRIADGWFPFAIGPRELAEAAAGLRAAAAGRPVEVTAWPGSAAGIDELDHEVVQAYVDAGATRLVVQPTLTDDDPIGALRRQLDGYRNRVIDRLRPARAPVPSRGTTV